jgi:uncharacterized protein YjgD (DUF1641 family)
MTEYNTPLTPAQQEISELLEAVKEAVSDLRDLSKSLHRVGLHEVALDIQQTAWKLDTTYNPLAARFVRGEI